MKQICLGFFIIALLVSGCKKKDHTPAEATAPLSRLPLFSGYTSTDNVGVPTGLTDATDWRTDDTWSDMEKALFANYSIYNDNCAPDTGISIQPAYPNPSSNVFFLAMEKDSATWFGIRVVNQDADVLIATDSIYPSNIVFDLSGLTTPSDSLVRAYYMFVRSDSCMFKGHGDIWVN